MSYNENDGQRWLKAEYRIPCLINNSTLGKYAFICFTPGRNLCKFEQQKLLKKKIQVLGQKVKEARWKLIGKRRAGIRIKIEWKQTKSNSVCWMGGKENNFEAYPN